MFRGSDLMANKAACAFVIHCDERRGLRKIARALDRVQGLVSADFGLEPEGPKFKGTRELPAFA